MCVFATKPLLTLEIRCLHCLRAKVSKSASSRGLAIKTQRSGGGECVFLLLTPDNAGNSMLALLACESV